MANKREEPSPPLVQIKQRPQGHVRGRRQFLRHRSNPSKPTHNPSKTTTILINAAALPISLSPVSVLLFARSQESPPLATPQRGQIRNSMITPLPPIHHPTSSMPSIHPNHQCTANKHRPRLKPTIPGRARHFIRESSRYHMLAGQFVVALHPLPPLPHIAPSSRRYISLTIPSCQKQKTKGRQRVAMCRSIGSGDIHDTPPCLPLSLKTKTSPDADPTPYQNDKKGDRDRPLTPLRPASS